MEMKQLALKALSVASTMVIGSVVAVTPAWATANYFDRGVRVFDNFDHKKTILQPEENAYWWIDGQGTLPDGGAARVRGRDNCQLQTCVEIIKKDDSDDSFVRLQGFPTTTTANYTNANLSEDVDGADGDPVYDGHLYPGPWNPSVNHPIEVETRLRFGPNFRKDGTGGAKGTAGVWLWSNPFSQENADPFSIYDGIGFSWSSVDSEVIQGLTMTVLKGTVPMFFQPVTANININDWNTYRFVWSRDLLGNQYVTYYINGAFQAVALMPIGVSAMQNLGLEVWVDNQAFQPSKYPDYVQRIIIDQERHIDLDYVSIKKL